MCFCFSIPYFKKTVDQWEEIQRMAIGSISNPQNTAQNTVKMFSLKKRWQDKSSNMKKTKNKGRISFFMSLVSK